MNIMYFDKDKYSLQDVSVEPLLRVRNIIDDQLVTKSCESSNTKSPNVVRMIDDIGRVAIPKEIRNELHIHAGNKLEFTVRGDVICVTKHSPDATD